MKTLYTLIICLFMLTTSFGQFIFDLEDMPINGDSVVYHVDTTNYALGFGTSGENQIWDYSTLQADESFTVYYEDPEGTGAGSSFPTANQAVDFGGAGFYAFIEHSTTESNIIGFAGDFFGDGSTVANTYDDPQRQFEFPVDFGDSFADDYSFSVTFDGSAFDVDSIRFTRSGTYSINVDSWGKLLLPNGTFWTMRQRVVDSYTDLVEIMTFGFWVEVDESTGTDESFEWIARESHGAILTLDVESETGEILGISYADVEALSPTSIDELEQAIDVAVFPNPAAKDVQVEINAKGTFQVDIYSQAGVLMYSRTNLLEGIHKLPIQEYPNGNYFILITNEEDRSTAIKSLVIKD